MADHAPMTRTSVWIADGLLALAVFCFAMFGDAFTGVTGTVRAVVQSLLFALPVAARRIAPDLATLAIIPAFVLQLATSSTPLTGDITAPMMMYAVAAYGQEHWTRLWLAFGLLTSGIAGATWAMASFGLGELLVTFLTLTGACAAAVTAAWFMGSLRRSTVARQTSDAERAAALQREQVQAVQLAATNERQRIAREMHDIVAHSLSIIVVQADGARYVVAEAPGDAQARLDKAAAAIETIASTARAALGETRRLVGVLHSEETSELTPTEGLADIPALVEGLTTAGRKAWLVADGDPASHPPLAAVAELAAYRVVQESLTNVLKHAGPDASTWVVLHHRPEGLTVGVRDDGPGSGGGDGHGHGLSGLRERVGSLGGTLFAHSVPGGGFEVAAYIPATTQGVT